MTRQAARSQAGLVTAVTAMTLADAVGGTGLPPRPGRCRPGGRRGPARHRGSLRTTYEGREYQGFIAVGNDAVELGLNRRPGADPAASGLIWQLGVSDVNVAIAACERARVRFEVTSRGRARTGSIGLSGTARRTGSAKLRLETHYSAG